MIMMICFKHFFVLFCFPIHSFLSALFENINQSDGWMDKDNNKKTMKMYNLKKDFFFENFSRISFWYRKKNAYEKKMERNRSKTCVRVCGRPLYIMIFLKFGYDFFFLLIILMTWTNFSFRMIFLFCLTISFFFCYLNPIKWNNNDDFYFIKFFFLIKKYRIGHNNEKKIEGKMKILMI